MLSSKFILLTCSTGTFAKRLNYVLASRYSLKHVIYDWSSGLM